MNLERCEIGLIELIAEAKRHRETAIQNDDVFASHLSGTLTASERTFVEHRRATNKRDIELLTGMITEGEQCLSLIESDDRGAAAVCFDRFETLLHEWRGNAD